MARPPRELSRRAALGALSIPVCGAVGGCLDSLDPSSPCSDPTRFSLQAVNPGSHATNEFSEGLQGLPYGTEAVVSAAMDAGEATVRDFYAPELYKQYVVSGQGERFYRVTTADRDPAAVTGYEYAVEIDDGGPGGDRVHPFEGLPAHDRESIHRALGNDHLLDAPHYDSFSVVFAYEEASDRDRSRFVPAADGTRVGWDDSLLRFSFEGTTSVTLTTTTVTAKRVANSGADFFEHVFDEHGVALADLQGDRRSVVDEAIEDGVTECPPHSESFAAVLDRLRTGDAEFARLVEYDGIRYFTHVSAMSAERP